MLRLLVLSCLLASAGWAQAKPATLFLVRHAERAGGMALDVPISEAGQERAHLLARMLGDAGISRIVASEAKRTQQTASPLADRLGLTAEVVKGGDVENLVAAARKLAPGSKSVFVRHSNELVPLVEKLGGGTIPPLPDTEFDRFLVITLQDGRAVAVSTLRYGK